VARGVSIRIFLVEGRPEGLRLVEKSNWTGVGLMWPRATHASARTRPELDRAGVYVLVGPAESALDRPRVYVGEGDVLRKRLDQHHASKDFWTRAIAFTAKDASLNKAHVKYLEARLLAIAHLVGRAEIDNGNVPALPALSEPETADVDAFLDEILFLLPVLDLRAFEQVEHAATGPVRLKLAGPAHAEGRESGDGFIVFAGAVGRLAEQPSIHPYLAELRSKLLDQGVLEQRPDGLHVLRDYEFNSPSTAAGVLLGRAANGRIEWKDSHGKTLKQIQAEAVRPSSHAT
jgi:hypothetical protein